MYDVALIDERGGGRLHDNLSNYDRGRRQIPLKSDNDNEYVKARDEYDRAAVAFDKARAGSWRPVARSRPSWTSSAPRSGTSSAKGRA